MKKIKQLVNKIRSLKAKLTHDNLFDLALGGFLACIGVALYRNKIKN